MHVYSPIPYETLVQNTVQTIVFLSYLISKKVPFSVV